MNELLYGRYEKLKNRQKYFLVDYDELKDIVNESIGDENNFCFESQIDMDYPTDVWCEQFAETRYDSAIFIYGIGHFMYLRKFIKTVKYGAVVVYEPNKKRFAQYLCQDVIDVLDTNGIYFITGEERYKYLRESLDSFLNYNNRMQFYVAQIPNYSKRYEKDYEEFCNIIKTKCDNIVVEKNTMISTGEIQSYNYLNNLFKLVNEAGIQELCDALHDLCKYPAVVVSAGPSLDKNVELLKNYKGRVFMVAVDAALNTLKKHSIVPDLVITIDAKFESIKAMQDEKYNNLPMIVNTLSGYKLLRSHKGREFFDVQEGEAIAGIAARYGKNLPVLGTGGSVANSAFSFLQFVGFNTIILIGQDLAYPDNRFHASGAFENEGEVETTSNKYYYVEDIYGGKVLTEKNMDLYRLWFEDIIRHDKKINVIDATEGGALIRGTTIMSLQEAVDKYAMDDVADFTNTIDNAKYLFMEDERLQVKNEITEIYSSVDDTIVRLRQGKRLYTKLEDLCIKGKVGTKQFSKITEKIKELTNYIDYDPKMSMFVLYATEERTKVIDNMSSGSSDFTHEIHNLADAGRKMLDAYILAGDKIKKDWERYCVENGRDRS